MYFSTAKCSIWESSGKSALMTRRATPYQCGRTCLNVRDEEEAMKHMSMLTHLATRGRRIASADFPCSVIPAKAGIQ
jgi:hypothetical protein